MPNPLALFALAAGLALFGEARAAIVYFSGQDITIPNTYAGVSVDLETGIWSTELDGLAGGDANFFLGGARVSNDAYADSLTATWQPVRTGTGNTDAIVRLDVGTTIDVSTAVDPTLSSVAMGYTTCGFEAARLLDHLMQGAKPPSAVTFCPPRELVLRRSSDVFAVSDPKVALALRHMAEHSSGPLAVAGIALAAGVGRKTLERRFQQHIGRTINDELIRIRIAKLKRLLVEGEENVAKLSDVAGFGNLVSMHMLFKRATGMTPRQYRERHGPRPARSDSGV